MRPVLIQVVAVTTATILGVQIVAAITAPQLQYPAAANIAAANTNILQQAVQWVENLFRAPTPANEKQTASAAVALKATPPRAGANPAGSPRVLAAATSVPTPVASLPTYITKAQLEARLQQFRNSLPLAVFSPLITPAAQSGYVTQADLASQIAQLQTDFGKTIYGASYPTPAPNYAGGGIMNSIALATRIDRLSGTSLTNITVDGVSGLTDADVPDSITASSYLPLTGGSLTFASSTMFSVFNNAYFGATATSSFDSAGALTMGENIILNGKYLSGDGGDEGVYVDTSGNVGIGTTTPWGKLSVTGAGTGMGVNFLLADSNNSPIFKVLDNGTATLTGGLTASALSAFSGGLTSYASSTIGNGTQAGGLTISGGATTTGNAYFAGSVAIGTTTPSFSGGALGGLLISGDPVTDRILEIHNNYAEGIDVFSHSDTGFRAPQINLYKSKGSQLAPTAVANTNDLGHLVFGGYTGSSYVNGAAIFGVAEGGWTGTSAPGALTFYTVPSGSTSQLERMRITNGGNVGIGTTTPSGRLNVYIDGNSPELVIDEGDVGFPSTMLSFGGGTVSAAPTNPLVYANANNLVLESKDSQLLYLNLDSAGNVSIAQGGGNVGIGNTSPAYKFDVTGAGHFTSYVDAANFVATSSATASIFTGGFLSLASSTIGNGSTGLTINGTATTTLLHTFLNGFLSLASSTVGAGTQTGGLTVNGGATTTGHLTLSGTAANIILGSNYLSGDGADEGIAVDSTGQVGIGTGAPQVQFEVHTASGGSPSFLLSDDDVSHGLTTTLKTNGVFNFKTYDGTAGGAWLTGASDAGNTPGTVLQGIIGVTDPTDATPAISLNGSKKNTTVEGPLGALETVFQVESGQVGAATKMLTILGSGNVGIGNTSPNEKLNVQGAVAAQYFNATSTTVASTFAYNVGIGTTTPYSRLTVWGPDTEAGTAAFLVANSASTTEFAVYDDGSATLAGTLTQNSDVRLKTNVESLDASSTLGLIAQLNPVAFRWADPAKSLTPQLGFIAQDVQKVFPQLVSTTSPTAQTPDGTLGLNYIGFIAPIVESIKALMAELHDLSTTIANFADIFTTKELTFSRATGQELCLSDSSNDPNPVCITKTQLAALLSQSAAAGFANPLPASPTPSLANPTPATDPSGLANPSPAPSQPQDTDPPVITINGNNPAHINVGDTYNDLGASVTDNVDSNLGIHTFVGTTPIDQAVIDTSAPTTYHIYYVATDSAGNTATSTRTVIIEPAAAEAPPVPAIDATTTATSIAQ